MYVKDITKQAVVAAIYVICCVALAPISFTVIQFRMSEALMFLPFYNKKYTIGLTIGCFIANCFSPLGIFDMIFGTLSTLIACLLITKLKNKWLIAPVAAVVMAAIIPFELYYVLNEPFWFSVLTIFISEIIVVFLGVLAAGAFEKTVLKREAKSDAR